MTINKDKSELFPFICTYCRGIYDCEYDEDGKCLCPECDCDKINKFETNANKQDEIDCKQGES